MASPINVGTTAIVAVSKNRRRSSVRFQNTSDTETMYFTRQLGINPNIPSPTNYEFLLKPKDTNEAYIVTDSTAQFNVVSSGNTGTLGIYETINI